MLAITLASGPGLLALAQVPEPPEPTAEILPAGVAEAAEDGPTWAFGPVRWLFQPSEERELRKLESGEDLLAFAERFWRRRDPTPEDPENPNYELFSERVRTADALYSDPLERGSLTLRGRAYILLGPPNFLSQKPERTVEWNPERWRGRPASGGMLLVETWGYRPEDLSPQVRAELGHRGWPVELTLRFVVRQDGHYLLEGERLLLLAAQSYLRAEGEEAPER